MKSRILGIGAVAISIAFASCDKQLDLLPSDSITQANVFQSVGDLEQGLIGVYGSANGENNMYYGAILADEAKISNENRGQGQFEFKWEITSDGALAGFWNGAYAMIDRGNRVLQEFDKVTPVNPAESAQKELVRAELLALRAITHYEILFRYAGKYNATALGIPYTTVSDITAKPARLTQAETLQRIEAELSSAKAGLPTAPPSGLIRLSKAVAAGYQARIALWKGDWAAAATFASEAIQASGKTLASRAEFPGIWNELNESEIMWKQRRNGTGVGTLWQDNNGDVFFEPSDKVKGLFDRANDVRFNSFFRINPAAQDTALIYKFFESPRGPKILDVKSMRVAEMYLIRAEANAEQNKLSDAANDINTLRTARVNGHTNISYASREAAIADILNERFRELCFEGFRFFDLKRRGLPLARLASDVQSSAWQNFPATDHRFAWPVPTGSIQSNPNMQQNPGY